MIAPPQLADVVLKLLRSPKYQPLDKVGITKQLRLDSDRRAELRAVLRDLEQRGEIARIRKDRYVLPDAANLCTGILQVHPSASAHLVCESGTREFYVAAENTGVAMHRDRVVARLISAAEKPPSAKAGKPEAQVIRILQRANETVVGTLQQTRKNLFYVIPDEPRLPHDIYVNPGEHALRSPPRIGDKVVVKLDPWQSRHINPEGEIIEVLGAAGDPGIDIISIIRKYNLPADFPLPVLRDVEKIADRIAPAELAGREDLRRDLIITIDPDDAKDFDDAIHVERHSDEWRLGVHIADVSHYVKVGSPLDREAFERGNSVYLVDRVIPMLPEKLSNGICSLKPGVDRLTQSAFIDFTRDGKIKSVRFARTVICSAARLTYRQAFSLLAGKKMEPLPVNVPDKTAVISPAIAERVRVAWELAALLRKNRFAAGSLDLDFPEAKVWLDEKKQPVRIEKIENDISHQLVEEFMLVANEVVARELTQRHIPAIYRVHEDPDPERLGEFRDIAATHNFRAGDLTNRREVQRFLATLRGAPEEYAIKLAFLRRLKRATYDPAPRGHYGLAKSNYAHFTSPIRRYADLVVHRAFQQIAGGRRAVPPTRRLAFKDDLAATATHISNTERDAAEAEKESVKLKKMQFFQNQLQSRRPEEFRAVVVEVRAFGVFIELPDILVSGLVHVSSLADDFYTFDTARLRFVGRRTGKTYQIGDVLQVIVSRVDVYKRQIDFAIVSPASRRQEAPPSVRRRRPRRS